MLSSMHRQDWYEHASSFLWNFLLWTWHDESKNFYMPCDLYLQAAMQYIQVKWWQHHIYNTFCLINLNIRAHNLGHRKRLRLFYSLNYYLLYELENYTGCSIKINNRIFLVFFQSKKKSLLPSEKNALNKPSQQNNLKSASREIMVEKGKSRNLPSNKGTSINDIKSLLVIFDCLFDFIIG